MGTTQVDALQTAQIIALQTDVAELREKLNLAISDELALSSKLNTLIDDLNNMNEVIMAGYTTPGSPESYGILEGMDVHKDEMTEHISRNTPHEPFWPYNDPSRPEYWDREADMTGGDYDFPWWYSPSFAIPKFYDQWITHAVTGASDEWRPEASGGRDYRTSGNIPGNSWTAGDPALGGTGQSGNAANTSTVADNASVTGLYESYRENLLGLEPEAAIRAKKLVRNILKKIRKK